MTSPEPQETLAHAIAALKAGKKAEARRLLEGILATDRYNEQAWLWMSGVVDTDAERVVCLENVLTLNPYNERARKGLEQLGRTPPSLPIIPLLSPQTPTNIPSLPSAPTPSATSLETSISPSNSSRTEVADYRLYIVVVIALSLMLICAVVGIVAAALFFTPGG
ncbi:MAG: tetratricopeptide repeat protein [Anaerolineae bacterium]